MYVKVVLKDSTLEFDKEYLYLVPESLEGKCKPGVRVLVPFGQGNKETLGFVIEISDENESPFYVKPINSIESDIPILLEEQIKLAFLMKKKYSCTYGDAINLMIPQYTVPNTKTDKTAFLLDPQDAQTMISEGEISHINQFRVIEFLLEYGESLQSEIISSCKISKSTLNTLRKKQIIDFGKKDVDVEEKSQIDLIEDILQKPFVPNLQQKEAIDTIINNDQEEKVEYLLRGITGSGKTEVYLHVLRNFLDKDKGAILLVPEISLTPQMIKRLTLRFGGDVRVLHSRLTPKEKFLQWQDILFGKAKIVVGARSAVFAPVRNLALIIIDEEQETSYKSQTHPKYDAADIARLRMTNNKGTLILGSATPKVETFYRTFTGQTKLLTISDRANNSTLPKTHIVDLREELAQGNTSIFSRLLKNTMLKAFEKNHQVILFINRRGYNGFYLCRDCGYVPKCDDCSVSLTYHLTNKSFICHYCGRIYHPPKICPKCQSKRIGGFGIGTQKVEELCKIEFPGKKILRMDQDTTTGRGSHAYILEEFEKGNADILIGTQMVAKGHDYENVTVVGILSADQILGISDFRSSERNFQLITQSCGRAGRGKNKGEVIIQTYNPEEYSIAYGAKQDYLKFYNHEIKFREVMGYPPFAVIGVVLISAPTDELAYKSAKRLKLEIVECAKDNCVYPYQDESIEVMDLAKAPIHVIRNRYRYRIIIKAKLERTLAFHFARVSKLKFDKDVLISYDINPTQMN